MGANPIMREINGCSKLSYQRANGHNKRSSLTYFPEEKLTVQEELDFFRLLINQCYSLL